MAGFFAFQGEKSCISYHFCAQFGKDAIITVKNVKNSLETVVDVMKRIKSILLLLFLLLLGGCHNQPEPKSETIRIALLDTGIAGAAIAPESLLPGWNYLTDTEETEDTVNHGTAVASVIVGCENAGVQGIAPEALLIPLVVADKNATASPEVLAQAIRDGVDKFDADILNISLGLSEDVRAFWWWRPWVTAVQRASCFIRRLMIRCWRLAQLMSWGRFRHFPSPGQTFLRPARIFGWLPGVAKRMARAALHTPRALFPGWRPVGWQIRRKPRPIYEKVCVKFCVQMAISGRIILQRPNVYKII